MAIIELTPPIQEALETAGGGRIIELTPPTGAPDAEIQIEGTKPEKSRAAGDVLESLLQGATFGFSDEIQAFLQAAVTSPFVDDQSFGQIMSSARKDIREQQQRFAEEQPAIALASEVIGGFATGGVGAVRAGITGAKELAKTGSVLGAIAGTGFADKESLASLETLESTLTGAAGGAVFSVLTPQVIKGLASVGSLIPENAPAKLLESALKFRPGIDPATRARMTRTALDEGILPTVKGLDNLTAKITTLDKNLNNIIDDATNAGTTIPKSVLFNQLKPLRQKLGGAKLEAGADIKNINAIAKSFDEQLKKIKKTNLTPREVQDLKVDAYNRIKFDLSQGKAGFAKNETRKAVARSAKEELEKIDPDIQSINQRLGSLLELRPELEKVVSRLDNRNLISLDTAAKVGAGAVVEPVIGTTVGVAASVLGNPRVKARTAIALENIRKAGNIAKEAERTLSPAAAQAIAVLIGSTQESLKNDLNDLQD